MKTRACMLALAILALLPLWAAAVLAEEPVTIGSRLELFVDEALIDRLGGDTRLEIHKPTPREVVFTTDKPWEGNTSAYFTIFDDDGLLRMYYRGSHFDEKARRATHPEVTCYAESRDGLNWTKPELGLVEFAGAKANNILWDGVGTHNFTPFRDANPACRPEARYKALGVGEGRWKHGLYAFESADAIHWKLMADEPVITEGDFDSQNLAFWDPVRGCYADYHRKFRDGVRDIMTCTSADFLHWSPPVLLEYPGAPNEHLYTNAVQPYRRAPHILIGFPTRFLPDRGEQVEPVFMSSRDGRTFRRWSEAIIPVTAPENRDGNRSNYMTWGLVELPGDDRELSVYATEAYYAGPAGRVRRFTYRIDGFVSARASGQGGDALTKPLVFDGRNLTINFATAAQGRLRVELQDAAGAPIEGFALADCPELRGDAIEQVVAWKAGPDVSRLAGRPIRLRFELTDADVFSYRFAP